MFDSKKKLKGGGGYAIRWTSRYMCKDIKRNKKDLSFSLPREKDFMIFEGGLAFKPWSPR
jgi:hypothetical protein